MLQPEQCDNVETIEMASRCQATLEEMDRIEVLESAVVECDVEAVLPNETLFDVKKKREERGYRRFHKQLWKKQKQKLKNNEKN